MHPTETWWSEFSLIFPATNHTTTPPLKNPSWPWLVAAAEKGKKSCNSWRSSAKPLKKERDFSLRLEDPMVRSGNLFELGLVTFLKMKSPFINPRALWYVSIFVSCSLFGFWESVVKWEINSNEWWWKEKKSAKFCSLRSQMMQSWKKEIFNCFFLYSYFQFSRRESAKREKILNVDATENVVLWKVVVSQIMGNIRHKTSVQLCLVFSSYVLTGFQYIMTTWVKIQNAG